MIWNLLEKAFIWMRFYLDKVFIQKLPNERGVLIWNVPEQKSSFGSFQMKGWCWLSGTFWKVPESSGRIQKWWRLLAGTFWKGLEVKVAISWNVPANLEISWNVLKVELRAAPPKREKVEFTQIKPYLDLELSPGRQPELADPKP